MSYVSRLLLRLLGKMCRVYGYCRVNGIAPGECGAALEG